MLFRQNDKTVRLRSVWQALFENRSYPYIHIMWNDKFSQPYVEFINKHFSSEEHFFVFFGGLPVQSFPVPPYKNVHYTTRLLDLLLLEACFQKCKKVFLHGLFNTSLVKYLALHTSLANKSYWCIWGGDLYGDKKLDETSRPFKIKKRLVCQLRGLITWNGDYEVAKSLYGFQDKASYLGYYISPINVDALEQHKVFDRKNKDTTVIQINNSADFSTIKILQQLHRFRDENILIRTILSYGDKDSIEAIKACGSELFKDKFKPLLEYLSPEEYAEYISNTDILILNQPRQQGVFNTLALLYMGAKVYLRSDTTTWSHFKETCNIEIYDTFSIDQLNFQTFVSASPLTAQKNSEIASRFFDEHYLQQVWQSVFMD